MHGFSKLSRLYYFKNNNNLEFFLFPIVLDIFTDKAKLADLILKNTYLNSLLEIIRVETR